MLSPTKDLVPNHFQHSVEVVVNLRIQEPEDLNPKRLNVFLALSVVFAGARLKVAVPIELDSQLGLDREEINHKWSDTILTAKLASKQLASFEPRPEDNLCFRHRTAKLPAPRRFAFAVEEFIHGVSPSRF